MAIMKFAAFLALISVSKSYGYCELGEVPSFGGLIELDILDDAFPLVEYCMVRGRYQPSARPLCLELGGTWTIRPSYLDESEDEGVTVEDVYKCEISKLLLDLKESPTEVWWVGEVDRYNYFCERKLMKTCTEYEYNISVTSKLPMPL